MPVLNWIGKDAVVRHDAEVPFRLLHDASELACGDAGQALFDFMCAQGVLGDWREPDIMRIAPAPLYNTYADCRRCVEVMQAWRAQAA